MRKRTISIPTAQYQELELFAKKYDLTVGQLVHQLLEKEIVENAKKELFTPGLKWMVPKAAIIMARTLKQDLPRLSIWNENKDRIAICQNGEDGELYLINESELLRRELQQVEAAAT